MKGQSLLGINGVAVSNMPMWNLLPDSSHTCYSHGPDKTVGIGA